MRISEAVRRGWPAPAMTAALLAAGTLAGRPDDPQYYRSLKQAPFAPPSWVFGPAWTLAKLGASIALTATALPLLARHDRSAAGALLPQAAWLTLATPTGIYQALANPDPLLGRNRAR
jgi:tryptophan-rich sensory protein